MTHRDQTSENGSSHDVGEAPHPEDVTRLQEGQYSVESEEVIPGEATEAQREARIERAAAETINALQVTMDRSGAESIRAQRVTMTNAGAKTVEAGSMKLTQSAAITVKADKADLRQSSALVLSAQEATLDHSSAAVIGAGTLTLGEANRIGMLPAGNVEASGSVHAFMIVSGNVKAGGNVQTTLNGVSAAALGAAFGIVVVLLRRLLGSRGQAASWPTRAVDHRRGGSETGNGSHQAGIQVWTGRSCRRGDRARRRRPPRSATR